VVERCDGRLTKPLGDGDDRSIDESLPEIGVPTAELADARVVVV
jgi:hypothetical protein